jgi:predicted transcriptional regulator
MRGLTKEEKMTATDRLWLNGFTTMSEVLANDRLALEEVRQALEDDSRSDEPWLAPWRAGLEAGIRACFGE